MKVYLVLDDDRPVFGVEVIAIFSTRKAANKCVKENIREWHNFHVVAYTVED